MTEPELQKKRNRKGCTAALAIAGLLLIALAAFVFWVDFAFNTHVFRKGSFKYAMLMDSDLIAQFPADSDAEVQYFYWPPDGTPTFNGVSIQPARPRNEVAAEMRSYLREQGFAARNSSDDEFSNERNGHYADIRMEDDGVVSMMEYWLGQYR